jgi:hypothetical protein
MASMTWETFLYHVPIFFMHMQSLEKKYTYDQAHNESMAEESTIPPPPELPGAVERARLQEGYQMSLRN